MFHIPLHRGGHRHKAKALASRGAVQHHRFVALFLVPFVDVKQRAQFLHAGEDGHFFGLNFAQAGGAQERTDVRPNALPVLFDFFLDVDFVNPEPVGHLERLIGFGIKQAGLKIKRIGQ